MPDGAGNQPGSGYAIKQGVIPCPGVSTRLSPFCKSQGDLHHCVSPTYQRTEKFSNCPARNNRGHLNISSPWNNGSHSAGGVNNIRSPDTPMIYREIIKHGQLPTEKYLRRHSASAVRYASDIKRERQTQKKSSGFLLPKETEQQSRAPCQIIPNGQIDQAGSPPANS